MKSQVLALALIAATALAKDCKYGVLEENCCVCEAGYQGDLCDTCAPGYVEQDGKCGNGRVGTPCTNNGLFPFLGCGGVGECTLTDKSESVFPCVCKNLQQEVVSCANKIVGDSTCAPQGPRMYTPFPNRPRFNHPFSLTAVMCNEVAPNLMLVPAFKEDGLTENSCSDRVGEFGGFPNECVVSGEGEINPDCLDGIVLTNLNSTDPDKNMAVFTFAGLVITKNDFRINSDSNENRKWFKVCSSQVVPVAPGSADVETVWVPVDAHDESVSSRAPSFRVAEEGAWVNGAGKLEGIGGGDCCDGLKMGFCLPLWAFLLLWVLMALCLGLLGYALHKNKNELDSRKNTTKYETFDTDAEMMHLAEKDAEHDDDI